MIGSKFIRRQNEETQESISICSEDFYYVSIFTYVYFIIQKGLCESDCVKGITEF